MSIILDGRKLARQIKDEVRQQASELLSDGVEPVLALVTATKDESAHSYVRSIVKTADKVGIKTKNVELKPDASYEEIHTELKKLAGDRKVDGIILQTPLPDNVDADALRALIPTAKDIDGANPLSAGQLMSGLPTFAPATAVAVMEMLKEYKTPLEGARTVMIGRSRVVGKPLAHLLLDANATVTICHSKTKDLAKVAQEAEILIVAIGKPNFIDTTYVSEGAVVIDVGTNVGADGELVGDVDSESIENKTSAYSPVPGGVGPVTTAILLRHTIQAALSLNKGDNTQVCI